MSGAGILWNGWLISEREISGFNDGRTSGRISFRVINWMKGRRSGEWSCRFSFVFRWCRGMSRIHHKLLEWIIMGTKRGWTMRAIVMVTSIHNDEKVAQLCFPLQSTRKILKWLRVRGDRIWNWIQFVTCKSELDIKALNENFPKLIQQNKITNYLALVCHKNRINLATSLRYLINRLAASAIACVSGKLNYALLVCGGKVSVSGRKKKKASQYSRRHIQQTDLCRRLSSFFFPLSLWASAEKTKEKGSHFHRHSLNSCACFEAT